MKAALIGLLLTAGVVAQAQAQTGTLEFVVGGVANGAASRGTTRAELLDSAGNPVTLFEAAHRTAPAVGLIVGVGIRVRPRLGFEVAGTWAKPDLETRIRDDFEGTPDTLLMIAMHRFTADAAVIKYFARRGALEPYVRLGGGWFRDLTADRALVDNGFAGQLGGGASYWVREGRRGWFGSVALRADVRLVMRRGGVTFGDAGIRWSPAASGGVVIAR